MDDRVLCKPLVVDRRRGQRGKIGRQAKSSRTADLEDVEQESCQPRRQNGTVGGTATCPGRVGAQRRKAESGGWGSPAASLPKNGLVPRVLQLYLES